MKKTEDMTIADRLKAHGYSHHRINDGGRINVEDAHGYPMGRMDAFEAARLCRLLEANAAMRAALERVIEVNGYNAAGGEPVDFPYIAACRAALELARRY